MSLNQQQTPTRGTIAGVTIRTRITGSDLFTAGAAPTPTTPTRVLVTASPAVPTMAPATLADPNASPVRVADKACRRLMF